MLNCTFKSLHLTK